MEDKNGDNNTFTILDLPVYALRILLSFLDATDLYHMSQTCTYLRDCIEDPRFWKYIDARSLPNTSLKLLYCTDQAHEKTTNIFFGAKAGFAKIPPYFFSKIKHFENLRVLSLEYQKLSGFGVSLNDFPPSLEEISLRGTVMKSKDSVTFFQYSSPNMTKLRVLILDDCTWLTCSFLISVAKYDNLEIISVVNCPRIHLHTVPYLNIAKYGLKKLKVFDCRFTGIGSELLNTFYSKESIQRFYFQSFSCARVDYKKSFPHSSKIRMQNDGVELQISNFSLLPYQTVTVADGVPEKICDSVLYKDPYPPCKCGFKDYHENGPVLDCEISEEDIPVPQVTKFICDKHFRDMKNVPDYLRDLRASFNQLSTPVLDDDASDENDSSDEESHCCRIANSKMVILQNFSDPSQSQEIVIPGNRHGRQMNIFIVNPLADRENRRVNEQRDNPNRENDRADGADRASNRFNFIRSVGVCANMDRAEDGAGGSGATNDAPPPENDNGRNENIDNKREEKEKKNDGSIEYDRGHDDQENDANENSDNRTKESSDCRKWIFDNMPGTSRGTLENCMNENTENVKIERERMQNESETEEGNNSDSENDRNKTSHESNACDKDNKALNLVIDNLKNANSGEKKTTLSEETTSRKRRNIDTTSEEVYNQPSCSGLQTDGRNECSENPMDLGVSSPKKQRFSDFSGDIGDSTSEKPPEDDSEPEPGTSKDCDNKRKRPNDKNEITRQRNKHTKRLFELLKGVERYIMEEGVANKRANQQSAENSRNVPTLDNRSSVEQRPAASGPTPAGRDGADQKSTASVSTPAGRDEAERRPAVSPAGSSDASRAVPAPLGLFNRNEPEPMRPLDRRPPIEYIPQLVREALGRCYSHEQRWRADDDGAEGGADADQEPYRREHNPHLFRIFRASNNAEQGRRINIRQIVPWPNNPVQENPVIAGNRLRYRFPPNEQKVFLTHLSLRGYKRINDMSLYYLKHLNLELLDLTYTSVTKQGIEAFLLENPNCRIIHQNYCLCKPVNPF